MEVKTAVTALTALAQESRLRVFRLLVRAGSDGQPAGEIADSLDIPPATLTFHLKELSHAGLIDSTREGRSIRYSIREQGVCELLTYLLQDCCNGQPELCGSKRKK
ncbi:ArsR/SmtB family transcription factor [Bythopirellula polymerisocia]|uniref:Putative HTH-type transcriptional regulator YgaV n=1 Tax=Bythopirellula polymerisocia TaxID=2528003 RepID=A0A5C6D1A7_9BACT|nr:metalloregulator ArsR/SmtB family transcription factor [Bythopirellula polymerisocia]TWU29975.1 putative HTH-type transcriptional regulator YgaV [Bythopirellula polymerisocia]